MDLRQISDTYSNLFIYLFSGWSPIFPLNIALLSNLISSCASDSLTESQL